MVERGTFREIKREWVAKVYIYDVKMVFNKTCSHERSLNLRGKNSLDLGRAHERSANFSHLMSKIVVTKKSFPPIRGFEIQIIRIDFGQS